MELAPLEEIQRKVDAIVDKLERLKAIFHPPPQIPAEISSARYENPQQQQQEEAKKNPEEQAAAEDQGSVSDGDQKIKQPRDHLKARKKPPAAGFSILEDNVAAALKVRRKPMKKAAVPTRKRRPLAPIV